MANEYATLAELKTHLNINDTTYDTELSAKLTAASRRVDQDTGRRFWQDSVTSTRIYKPTHPELLLVDDISTTTGLIVETGRGTSWSTLDSNSYELLPENASNDSVAIEAIQRAYGCWPTCGPTRVRVTAKWGWATVPDTIKAATLLIAARTFRRKDSPEGVAGLNDLGTVLISRYDPDYAALIGPYERPVL